VAVDVPPTTPAAPAAATRRAGAGASLRAAIALLTRLPVRPDETAVSGAAAFPLVGAIVGFVGAVPLALASAGEPVLAGILAVGAMTVLTGALHLDGLADTADALLAPDRATAERARKDPAVGPGGAVALIVVLGIEVAALASLASSAGALSAGAALIVAAVVGRTLPVVTVVLAPSRVEAGGFGGWFAARVGRGDAIVAVGIALVLSGGLAIATGSPALALEGLAGAAIGLVVAAAIVRGRGLLDGDGMGAIIETTVAACLVVAAVAP
jgi:adenosylcobinamide-GDP ribazoletransferase